MTDREKFEAWITKPPYERDLMRWADSGDWPLQYIHYDVQLAWEAWQEARKG